MILPRNSPTLGDHPAIGEGDVVAFGVALAEEFGEDVTTRPFLFYDHGKCAVVNFPSAVWFELAPRVAGIGRRFGLNSSQF